jgi:hypothetical protein
LSVPRTQRKLKFTTLARQDDKPNVKQITNLLHLLAGIVLLALGGYFARTLIHNGKERWGHESAVTAQAENSQKAGPANDDPTLSAANLQVYGVLSQNKSAQSGNGPAQKSASTQASVDRVSPDSPGANHFLHQRLSLESDQIFAFEVPARSLRPQLDGMFRSIATRSGSPPAVEVLLLNEEEFARFASSRARTATFSSAPSNHGEIHWPLSASRGDARKYYLVFRKSSGPRSAALVDADSTASFE